MSDEPFIPRTLCMEPVSGRACLDPKMGVTYYHEEDFKALELQIETLADWVKNVNCPLNCNDGRLVVEKHPPMFPQETHDVDVGPCRFCEKRDAVLAQQQEPAK